MKELIQREGKTLTLTLTLTLLAVLAPSAEAYQYGTLTNPVLYTNNVASTVISTNMTGNTVPIQPFKDAMVFVAFIPYGTNAPTTTGTIGIDLYDANLGVWTTGQPIQASVGILATNLTGAGNPSVTRTFFSQTNFLGASLVRWDTATVTGATNGVFQVDIIQGN